MMSNATGQTSTPPASSRGDQHTFRTFLRVAVAVAALTAGLMGFVAGHSVDRVDKVPLDNFPPASSRVPSAPSGFRFYLAGSPEQAASLEDVLPVEGPLADHVVAVISSADDLARVQGAAALIDGAVIADLRPAASRSDAAAATAPSEASVRIYLVGSQEQAEDIAYDRFGSGSPSADAEIVQAGSPQEARWALSEVRGLQVLDVVASSADEARTRARLATIGYLRQALDESGIQIADLREP